MADEAAEQPRALDTQTEFRDAACTLARDARLQLSILTYAFEREIYGHTDFVQAVQSLTTRHRRARVRILIHSPEWASRSGHRLVELARRLSSFIELREMNEQDKQLTSEVLIVDEKALLLRESPDVIQARLYPDDSRLAGGWQRRFEGLWNGGEIVQGLRQLNT